MNGVLGSSIKSASERIAAGEIRPTELARAALRLTGTILRPLNAFTCLSTDLAERGAVESEDRWSRGHQLGPLDGLPVAVKDNFCVAGVPTSCGSRMLADFVPGYDATAWTRLRDRAGALLLGKTNLDEFAMGSATLDSFFGPAKNLWGSEVMRAHYHLNDACPTTEQHRTESLETAESEDWRLAGGSSGGSAIAVASGACFAALGSDTGGSTRNPASYCGLVGLKPTYGLISRHGLVSLVNSMDVPGILARSVDDVLAVLNVVAGPDPLDPTSRARTYTPIELPACPDVSGLRVGLPREYGRADLISDEVARNWQEVARLLAEAGARVRPVSMPYTEYSISCYAVLNRCEVASNMARYDGLKYGYRARENSSLEALYGATRREAFGDVVRARILAGNYFLLADNCKEYAERAMRVRRLVVRDFERVFDSGLDLLLSPTTLSEAPRYRDYVLGDDATDHAIEDFCTQPANMAGIPAVSVPTKLSASGLPLAVQLMAPSFGEDRLLAAAKWIEAAVNFPRLVLREESLTSCLAGD